MSDGKVTVDGDILHSEGVEVIRGHRSRPTDRRTEKLFRLVGPVRELKQRGRTEGGEEVGRSPHPTYSFPRSDVPINTPNPRGGHTVPSPPVTNPRVGSVIPTSILSSFFQW